MTDCLARTFAAALAMIALISNAVFSTPPGEPPAYKWCHISDTACVLKSKVCNITDTTCISYPTKLPGLHWYFWPPPPWNIGATSKDSVVAELSSDGTLSIGGKGKMMDFKFDYANRPWHIKCLEKNIKVVIENGVTGIGNEAFSVCKLTSIAIPSSVTFIGNYVCSLNGLTSIAIPSGVASFGVHAFSDCRSLEAINVASGNKTYSSKDGILYDKNFSTLIRFPGGKSGTATIPDGVTSIGDYAFSMSSLTSITIPVSVAYIGKAAFAWSSLKSITILNPVPPSLFAYDDWVGITAFNGVYCTIYVPKGSVDAYRKAEGWRDFRNIRPIE